MRVAHAYTHTHMQTSASFQSALCDTHIHTHAHAHTCIPRTHTLTRLLEKGVRIWEGMVLCIRPKPGNRHTSGYTGMHTLGHTIRVCEGGEAGEGDKVVGMQLRVYINRAMCMCVW